MQEEIENRTVNLVISMVRLSGRGILNAGRAFLNRNAHGKGSRVPGSAVMKGKVRVKDLVRQGDAVSSVPVTDSRIREFAQTARKYGVQFSVVKDKSEGKKRYLVFFKAKDDDVLTAVFKEYSQKLLKKQELDRPSIVKQLHHFRERLSLDRTKKVNRNRDRERSR